MHYGIPTSRLWREKPSKGQSRGQASHFSKGVSVMSGLQENYEPDVFLRQEAEGYWV